MKRAVSIIAKGSYHIGGKKVTIEGSAPIQTSFWPGGPPVTYDPNGDFQAGQMYVQYTRLEDPVVPYPVCMIHGGGLCGAMWEQTLFITSCMLRRNFLPWPGGSRMSTGLSVSLKLYTYTWSGGVGSFLATGVR